MRAAGGRKAGRSSLARLEALEAQERARVQAVEAAKEAQGMAALERLSDADLEALREHLAALDAGGPAWARCEQAVAALSEDTPHPAREDAERWKAAVDATPQGRPYPVPLPAFAGYFELCAARCDALLSRIDAGEVLPDGVDRAAARCVARWGAASWRLWAAEVQTMTGGRA